MPSGFGKAAVGPRLGIELDNADLILGAEGQLSILKFGSSMVIMARPTFDYTFIDAGNTWDVCLDAIAVFDVKQPAIEPYFGVGVGLFFFNPDNADGNVNFGFNLIGGAKFVNNGKIQPFVELRLTLGDVDPIALTGGVLFLLN